MQNREQGGVQEASAVNHMHRHGNQLSRNALYGSLLPEQVSISLDLRAFGLLLTSNPETK